MSDNTAQGAREHLHRVLDERLAQCEALSTERFDAEAREGYSRALGTLKAVLAHADLLRDRGEHMMAYSREVPEEFADDIHDAGVDFTYRAQHLYRIVEEGMGDG